MIYFIAGLSVGILLGMFILIDIAIVISKKKDEKKEVDKRLVNDIYEKDKER